MAPATCPMGAVAVAASTLRSFSQEIEQHVAHGPCANASRPSVLPLPRTAPWLGAHELGCGAQLVNPIACDGHGVCAPLLPELVTRGPVGIPADRPRPGPG